MGIEFNPLSDFPEIRTQKRVTNGDGLQGRIVLHTGTNETSATVDSDGSPVKLVRNKDGTLMKETKYKIDEKTGKETIYSVSRYSSKLSDDSKVIKTKVTYVDEDGDGFNDKMIVQKWENGKLVEEKTTYEEDINSVKNRFHLSYEIENRKMSAHDSGLYVY